MASEKHDVAITRIAEAAHSMNNSVQRCKNITAGSAVISLLNRKRL